MSKKLSILVVDDEKVICSLFDRALKRLGHKPVTVRSGEEAVRRVKKETFDLVFLDIKLPGIDGVEILREIKKISPKTQVIMMTGYAMEEKIKQALKLGATSCLRKPIHIKDIADTLKEIERERRSPS